VTEVDTWFEIAIARLGEEPARQHESTALDHLLKGSYRRDQAVVKAQACYKELVAVTEPRAQDFMARIVFPLAVSQGVEINPPRLSDLQDALSEFEPPSLYLSRRSYCQRPSDFEEYRLPLALPANFDVEDTVASYSCYRDQVARDRGWEYYRAIWFEHYLKDRSNAAPS
jgi:hypothetical protein